MKTRMYACALATTAVMASTPLSAWAAVTTSGCGGSLTSCTLTELFGGGSITVDGAVFENFAFVNAAPFSVEPNYSKVVVSGLDGGGLSPGPGVRVDGGGELAVQNTDLMEFAYTFTVSAPGAFLVKDNSLGLGSVTLVDGGLGGPRIEVNEAVRDMSSTLLGTKSVWADASLGSHTSDSLNFIPLSKIAVGSAVYLEGFGAGDAASLNGFTQQFSLVPVPIPTAVWLLASGLVGIGVIGRTRGMKGADA